MDDCFNFQIIAVSGLSALAFGYAKNGKRIYTKVSPILVLSSVATAFVPLGTYAAPQNATFLSQYFT